jgi:hypothetical protein
MLFLFRLLEVTRLTTACLPHLFTISTEETARQAIVFRYLPAYSLITAYITCSRRHPHTIHFGPTINAGKIGLIQNFSATSPQTPSAIFIACSAEKNRPVLSLAFGLPVSCAVCNYNPTAEKSNSVDRKQRVYGRFRDGG